MKKSIFLPFTLIVFLFCLSSCLREFDDNGVEDEEPKINVPPKQEPGFPDPTTKEEALFRDILNAIVARKKEVDISKYGIKYEKEKVAAEQEHVQLWNKFRKKHDFLFNMNFSYVQPAISYFGDGTIKILKLPYIYGESEDFNARYKELEAAIEEYYSTLSEGMSKVEMAYSIYNHLTKKVVYTYPKSGEGVASMVYHIPGALVNSKAVCQGYALACSMLLNGLGIKTKFVTGSVEGETVGHMWNKIYIEDKWYNMDATWDDDGRALTKNSCTGQSFLTSDESFEKINPKRTADEIDPDSVADDVTFEDSKYIFRNGSDKSHFAYKDDFWYYLDHKTMKVIKSEFNGKIGSELKAVSIPRNAKQEEKRIDFGRERIYFLNKKSSKYVIASIDYDGFEEKVERNDISSPINPNLKLKSDLDVIKKKDGLVKLRAEIALAKLKDLYYHGEEDYYKPESTGRKEFRNIIYTAEQILKNPPSDPEVASSLCKILRKARRQYSNVLTYSPNDESTKALTFQEEELFYEDAVIEYYK